MKKIFLPLITGLAIAALLGSCTKYNDQFTGLDDLAKPTNLAKYNYTLLDADYTTISKAALAAAGNATDSTNARSIGTNKYFTATVPASVNVPFLLKTKYPYGDIGSSALITYTFGLDKPAYLANLTTVNIITDAEYKSSLVWNDPVAYVSAFTPAKSPAAKLPAILAARYPTATSGTYKFVECNYSSTEATPGVVDFKYFYDDFETHTYTPSPTYTPIGENGWQQKDTSGVSIKANYNNRLFSLNHYAQVTSFGSAEVNNVFLITKQIDLSIAIAPQFTFQINVGYWNADCMTVWISEDFDGNKDHIKAATWVDLSSNFTFPQVPTGAYGVLASAGTANLTSYAGKKVYIAFKYSGTSKVGDTQKTTTYQIDNVKVSETRNALSIPSSEKQYLVYKFDGTNWIAPPAADGVFVALQPADYTSIGLSYISSTNVPLYLPNFLSTKFPYALNGDVKTVVYKSSSNVTYSGATQYTLTNGVWTSNTYKVSKTDQFLYTIDGWVFDPTITLDMVTADYKLMVDWVFGQDSIKVFSNPQYFNEEFYFGYSSRYGNVSFRLAGYRDPYIFPGYSYQIPFSTDTYLSSLTTDAAKANLLMNRIKIGMKIFLELRYPNAIPQVSGVDVYYNIRAKMYYPDCVTNVTTIYNFKYKCTAAGTPATFVYDSSGPL
jgi:hypothetical protein